MAGSYNIRSIVKKVSRSRKFVKQAQVRARRTFEKAKALMISEFNNHPVTKELEAGVSAANSSGTLNGYGNLFTFIGFSTGHKPIPPVRNLLISSVYLNMST